jgi:hypothetical protein
VVAIGGGRDADGEGGDVMLATCSMLTMLNDFDISSFIDRMASACLCRPTSSFWSHSTSIAIELMTFCDLEEGGQGVLMLLTSWSIAVPRVVQCGFLQLPNALKESVLL